MKPQYGINSIIPPGYELMRGVLIRSVPKRKNVDLVNPQFGTDIDQWTYDL